MILYHKNRCKRTIFYLLSYLEAHCATDYETVEFDSNGSLDEIVNSDENYILLSTMTAHDMLLTLHLIEKLRAKFNTLKVNIVLGGALFFVVDKEHVMKYIPEITHICEGNGESFLKTLVEKRLPRGIYHGKNFERIEHYIIKREFLNKIQRILITFDDNRCSWNRCRFCHHQNADEIRRKRNDVDTIVDDVVFYHDSGIKEFHFFDNDLNPKIFHNFLIKFHEKAGPVQDISFQIFGIRANNDFSIIKNSLWKQGLVSEVSIGAEFYSQDLLDLYKKGITTHDIDCSINTFLDFGTRVNIYLLFGVPGSCKRHIDDTLSLMKKYGRSIQYLPSFFRLCSDTRIYKEKEQFNIEINKPYRMNEFIGGDDLPPINTNYLKFNCWDNDEQRMVSRKEIMDKTLNLLEPVWNEAMHIPLKYLLLFREE